MSSMWGMDPESVRKFAKAVQAESNKIESIAKTLGAKVQSLPWKGPDATFFKNNWDSTYEKNLKTVAKALDGLSKDAEQEAKAQEEVSS